jgi:GTP cyclohydrolase II
MKKVLKLKFEFNPTLKEQLIMTGDAILIEESVNDSFWGSGKDGKGQNHLGNILMSLRSVYQKERIRSNFLDVKKNIKKN